MVFPELAICGYPPEDLLLRPGVPPSCRRALEELAADSHVILGLRRLPGAGHGPLQRLLRDSRTARASSVPQAAPAELRRLRRAPLLRARRRPARAAMGRRRRPRARRSARTSGWRGGPATEPAAAGAQIVINLSASPYHGAGSRREQMLHQRALDTVLRRPVQPGRWAGRAGLRRSLGGHRRRGRRWPGRAQFEQALLVVDLEP